MEVFVGISEGEAETTVSRSVDEANGGDIQDVMETVLQALHGAGFSWVKSVAVETRSGDMIWTG